MTRKELIKKIEHDNNRQMLFKTVMPHVLDILKKYNGKPYGEKTKAKIRQELIDKCGCALYLYNGYHEDISIVPLNSNGYNDFRYSYNDFNIYVKYPRRDGLRPLGKDNKINSEFDFSDFYMSDCHDYIDDPEAHADNILASFENLRERYDEFSRCISVFNNMLPSNVQHEYINGFRNYL